MKIHPKVAVIVWTIDPSDNMRFLLRHNKPFNVYKDEWTICFGNVEKEESLSSAARREVQEEFGIKNHYQVTDLEYTINYVDKKRGPCVIHFFALQVDNIDLAITLNEESIGYDWMLIDKVKNQMIHEDEKKAFDILISLSKKNNSIKIS